MKLELTQIFLAIPAPGSDGEPWGRTYRLYGIMIALGVLAALEMARRRWQAKGGDPEDMSALALWVIPAGLIGARLYHVLTDNVTYRGHWFDNPFGGPEAQSPLALWNGGLGIPGGLLFGFLAGYVVAKRRGMRIPNVADAIAPGVPLAQAIGRLGNYFNQELFGRPTDLPWGLYVDPQYRPPEYITFETFQPTFLYEGLWNLGLMAFLLWIDKKKVLRPGRLFILYIGGYFLGRLWVEALRSDEAKTIILGLRVNIWTSVLALLAVAAVLAFIGVRRKPDDDFSPYMDGHTFDHERGIVPAPGTGPDELAGSGATESADGTSEADAPGDPDAAGIEPDFEADYAARTGAGTGAGTDEANVPDRDPET
jgi:prolipoprotein diacylglyceryl transferase